MIGCDGGCVGLESSSESSELELELELDDELDDEDELELDELEADVAVFFELKFFLSLYGVTTLKNQPTHLLIVAKFHETRTDSDRDQPNFENLGPIRADPSVDP